MTEVNSLEEDVPASKNKLVNSTNEDILSSLVDGYSNWSNRSAISPWSFQIKEQLQLFKLQNYS